MVDSRRSSTLRLFSRAGVRVREKVNGWTILSLIAKVETHACDSRTSCGKTGYGAIDFHLPVYEHDRALVGRALHRLLRARRRLLGIDQRLRHDRVTRVLHHARSSPAAELQD